MKNNREEGQALIEFALVAPMLILLLCGVVYCGGLVIAQENLTIAARSVARRMALGATEASLSKGQGPKTTVAMRETALADAMPNHRGIELKKVSWGDGVESLDGYTAILVKHKSFPIKDKSYKFGVGVVFHGVKVSKSLRQDLAPIGKLASQMAPGVGLTNMLQADLAAASIMPAELPIKGSGRNDGVLEINDWITKIVNEKLTDTLE